MDPLSIATAAAASAKALFVAAELCMAFRNATRDIDHSVESLGSLSRGLAGVLSSLHQALQDPILKNPRNADHWVSVQDSVKSCEATISELEKNLAPLREAHANLAQQAWRAARLRLKQPEIDRVLSYLRTHSINLQLALQTVNVTITASVPGVLSRNQATRFDRLERMIVALRPRIEPADSLAQGEAASDALRTIDVDGNTTRLYWSASSIFSGSVGGTIRSAATDVPVEALQSQEPAFEDFSAIVPGNPGATGSEAGESLDDEQLAHIQNWLHRSPGDKIVEEEDASETAESDDDSDDELSSQVAANLFERGMKSYAQEKFGEARECLQRGIAQAGPLSPEKQDELKVPSMQFHYALCCIVESILGEAESSFLLVIKGSGSREEDARLLCFAHYHLARVQLKMDKLDLAERHCRKAVTKMKKEKSIGKTHPDYHKSLRLLALIVWANGSKYDAQAYSDQLPLSQQIPEDQFEQELSLVLQSHHSEITPRDDATENAGGLSIISDRITPLEDATENAGGLSIISNRSSSREDPTENAGGLSILSNRSTMQTLVASPSSVRSFTLPRPISIDSAEKGSKPTSFDMASTIKTQVSASRTSTSTMIIDYSSAAMKDITKRGFLKKNGAKKGIRWAVKEGRLDVLNVLLQDTSADVDMHKSNMFSADKTPLQIAASRGLYPICKRLLEANATVNLMIDGQTALDDAIENNHQDVCRLLLEHGAEVDGMSDQKMTPLTRAVQHDRISICQLLINYGDINEPNFKRTKKRRTALMHAAVHDKVRAARWLLDHGANVNGPEPDISTPLVEAARANAITACRLLLEYNADRELKTAKGTAVEAASGWLKQFIREWPVSRSWNLPESANGSNIMADPLGIGRQM